MPFSHCDYDESDLAAMQAAFDAASEALGLGADCKTQRERLAEIICHIAQTGELDPELMVRRAVECFQQFQVTITRVPVDHGTRSRSES